MGILQHQLWARRARRAASDQLPDQLNRLAKLGNGLIERCEFPEFEFLHAACGAPVAVDHGARLVTRAVGHPGLCTIVRERDRDERGAQVVDANLLTGGRVERSRCAAVVLAAPGLSD